MQSVWERSNKCNQCDYASCQAGNLKKHLKTHCWESKTNAINVNLPDLIRTLWVNIWKRTVETSWKIPTNVTDVEIYSLHICKSIQSINYRGYLKVHHLWKTIQFKSWFEKAFAHPPWMQRQNPPIWFVLWANFKSVQILEKISKCVGGLPYHVGTKCPNLFKIWSSLAWGSFNLGTETLRRFLSCVKRQCFFRSLSKDDIKLHWQHLKCLSLLCCSVCEVKLLEMS